MPDTILGMPKRTALWVIGGAVVLVVVVLAMRGRAAGGGAAATGPTGFGETPLEGTGGGGGYGTPGGLLGQQQDQQSGYEQQLRDLALGSARSEAALFGKQAEYESAILETETQKQRLVTEKLKAMDPRKAVKAPRGKTRLDPETGQFYGREEQSKGFIGDYITRPVGEGVARIIEGYSRAYTPGGGYAGSHTRPVRRTRGTPPIVAPPYGGRPV